MHLPSALDKIVSEQPYPLLFATVSGAHLYGFPSEDSDFDLRGAHILPVEQCIGLRDGAETIDASSMRDGLEIDLVSHDVKKFFTLLLRPNGYVLEQLLSPLVVHATPEYEELKALAPGCITCHHAHHYRGFAHNQWKLFSKESPPRVKPLLYVYRVLLTGIHLMQTGEVEANLVRLNEKFSLSFLTELIERKLNGKERSAVDGAEMDFHQREYERLLATLERAAEASSLPEEPSAEQALNDMLLRLRLSQGEGRPRG